VSRPRNILAVLAVGFEFAVELELQLTQLFPAVGVIISISPPATAAAARHTGTHLAHNTICGYVVF
jgi:hypothetical protein